MVDLCRRRPHRSAHPRRLNPELVDPEARRAVLRAAAVHAVRGLCMVEIQRRHGVSRLPEEEARELAVELRRLRRQAALWDMELDRVLGALDARDVAPVVLKGAALRSLVYRESVERVIADLDLLVGPEGFDRALEALADAGYRSVAPPEVRAAARRNHFHDRLEGPGGFLLELHWDLQPRSAPFALPVADVLARSIPMEGAKGRALTMTPEDMLLHIVSQSLDGGFRRLRRIVDIDRIAGTWPDLDWDAVTQRAREAGLARPTALALDLSRTLLRAPVPDRSLTRLRPPRRVVSRLRLMSLAPFALGAAREGRAAAGDALYLTLIDDRRARWRQALGLLRGRSGRNGPIEAESPGSILRSGPLRALKLVAFALTSCLGGTILRFTRSGGARWRANVRALPSRDADAGLGERTRG